MTPAPRRGYRRCTRCEKNRQERFFAPAGRVCSTCQKARVSAASRNQRLIETYGITEEEWNQLLRHQGGGCAICGGRRRGNLDTDHDHKTLQLRGLCCRRCNRRLLPACRDNVEILRAAIAYLESPPAVECFGGPRFTPM